jgi:hypothetical protein
MDGFGAEPFDVEGFVEVEGASGEVEGFGDGLVREDRIVAVADQQNLNHAVANC